MLMSVTTNPFMPYFGSHYLLQYANFSVSSVPVVREPSTSIIRNNHSRVRSWLEKSYESEALYEDKAISSPNRPTHQPENSAGQKSQGTDPSDDFFTFPTSTQQSKVYNSSKKGETTQKERLFDPQVTSTQISRTYPSKLMTETVQHKKGSGTPKASASGPGDFPFQRAFIGQVSH